MANGKKSFIAYCDWKETFESLPDDKAGQLIKHIFRYVSDEKPETDDVLINAVFANIKNTLKRDLKKWEKQHNQRVEAGKRSAEIRKQALTTVKRPLNENKQASTVNVSVSDSVSDSVNVKKKIKSVCPSFNEIKEYGEEKGYSLPVQKIIDFYTDGGNLNYWVDSNNKKVVRWKGKLSSIWFKEEYKIKPKENKKTFKLYANGGTTREIEADDLEQAKQKYHNHCGALIQDIIEVI